MEKKNMRSFLSKALPTMIAALLSVASVVSADNKVAYDQGYEVDESQLKGVYNTSASIDVESSWDFYANGSFIYWYAREQGLECGLLVPNNYTLNNVSIINFPFEYKPGFKVGIGTHFEYDDWNVYTQYTRLMFRKSTYMLTPLDNFTIAPLWEDGFSLSASPKRDLNARWKLNFNVIDLECARPFYIGKKLSFNPHAGLRGGWIKQRFITAAAGVSPLLTYNSYNRSNSWLFGAKAGVDTNWLIGGGFRFLGNAAGSLSYQKFKVREFIDYYLTASGPSSAHTNVAFYKNRVGQITPNIEGALGMGWDTYLDNKNWHFDISAAYEFTYYWNQNKMRSLRDADSNFIDADAGDLMMHGLTLNARVDF
jgi:hypothetical protein